MYEYFTTKLRISLHRKMVLLAFFIYPRERSECKGLKHNLERCMDVFREMGRRSRETITGWSIKGWSDVPKYR